MPTVIIVSLIDIFVILLIFVIVTTTFKKDKPKQPEVVVKLPETSAGAVGQAPAEPIKLTIDKEDKMYLDGTPVVAEDLKPALEKITAEAPGRPLALNADTKASFGIVIKVLGILKEAGVKDIPAFTEKK
jgi:biopolymer transport protein ExbD